MKVMDIANKIDKSENNSVWVNAEKLGYELGIDMHFCEQDRIKAYWVGKWYCTDSHVGYKIYFLDEKPVVLSSQIGRKCDERFSWFGLEEATLVRDYLLTLKQEEELSIDIADLNEDIGDSFKISYNNQIIDTDRVFLHGEKVEIVEILEDGDYCCPTKLIVKTPDGQKKIVDIRELDFGFHIIEDDAAMTAV